jgi:hypothetical protein
MDVPDFLKGMGVLITALYEAACFNNRPITALFTEI